MKQEINLSILSKGGKREGAGRKPSANPANKMATMKLTATQHAKFIELGGSRWVKRLIDESIAKPEYWCTIQLVK